MGRKGGGSRQKAAKTTCQNPVKIHSVDRGIRHPRDDRRRVRGNDPEICREGLTTDGVTRSVRRGAVGLDLLLYNESKRASAWSFMAVLVRRKCLVSSPTRKSVNIESNID